jgi:hypothetical protein
VPPTTQSESRRWSDLLSLNVARIVVNVEI